ncbi:MAG: glycosyltransferase family 39 protein [Chloroflexota bacterium]|nr:glycosyltransferase family 39 protein [Chloroflexota bacterium]
MTMTQSPRSTRILLLLIILGYAAAGACYAYFTPAWQAPDEPAHYNYIRYLVDEGRLPVLQMGDYPHEYLEEIKARRFPEEMSIAPLRYEFHQPPLYYALASVVYRATGGSLLALRLLSLLLGMGLLAVAWRLVRAIFPRRPGLALGAVAFIAFLPMHLAMTSAVNNDALAELLLAASALGLVRYLRASAGAGVRASARLAPARSAELGLLIGLGLVTKLSAFVTLPLALVALLIAPSGRWERLRDGLLIFGLAGLVLLPWLARNHLVYGGLDLLGLNRHNQIVIGQPRTAEWLEEMGWRGLLQAFLQTTFQSFWGQFGWMGVLLDSRIYELLKLLSALVAFGFLLFLIRAYQSLLSRWRLPLLLALWLSFTFLSYLWYNLQFVQHQGRYLFPALVPLGLVFALSLSEVLARSRAWSMAGFSLILVLLLTAEGLLLGGLDKWAIALGAGAGVFFILRGFFPRDWDEWVQGLPYMGLFALDFICLFGFIVPSLT